MGWTAGWREPGQSNRDFFQRELLNDHQKIVACRTVTPGPTHEYGRVFYAAVENLTADEEVWAMVVLIRGTPGTNYYAFKEMDESMGPAEDECPVEILDLLTPTEYEFAEQWRERCRHEVAA